MDFWRAFQDGTSVFFFVCVLDLVMHLIDKRDKGEFDYKDYTKGTFYGFAMASAAFLGSLFQWGGWGKS